MGGPLADVIAKAATIDPEARLPFDQLLPLLEAAETRQRARQADADASSAPLQPAASDAVGMPTNGFLASSVNPSELPKPEKRQSSAAKIRALSRRARGGRRDSFGAEVSEEDLRRKRRASLLSADSARSRKGHKDKPGRATCRGSASSSRSETLEA